MFYMYIYIFKRLNLLKRTLEEHSTMGIVFLSTSTGNTQQYHFLSSLLQIYHCSVLLIFNTIPRFQAS